MKSGDTIREEVVLRIDKEIGRGSYGTVYRAVQEGVNRPVAIKELHNAESSLDQLRKEAWVNGALIHPNVVSVILFDEKKGLIVMEYVSNSLKQRIHAYHDRRQRFDEAEIVNILTQCLDALAYAYEHGCRFHGDIKPGNILLTEEGTIKIGDFGVSLSYKTAPAILAGSETWAAPEVLKHWEEDHVWSGDQRSDLFSLGIIAFILLTGTNPFIDPTGMRKPREYILDPNFVPRVPTDLAPTVARVIAKLLAREPPNRYQSAQDALDDIHGLSQQPPVEVTEVVEKIGRRPVQVSLIDASSEELQRLAYQYNQDGDYPNGEKYATSAIEKNPRNLYAFQTRGFSRSNQGFAQEAVSDFTTAIQLCPKENTPKLGQLYYQRAYARRTMGEYQTACEDIRQALQYEPTSSKYIYFRSRVCIDK